MSNYDWKKFTIPLMFGVGIDIIILVLNCITKGENLIFSSLTQGEVLTGIVLAFPALITWNISIKDRVQLEQEKSENETKQLENRTRQLENEKRRIAQQVLDVVKYYDEQLYEITNEVRKDGTLSSQKSSKIVYIVD
ncbi:hypothetical protein ACMZ6Z_05600 [Streptococcus pluranimalium]|uniref:hypothetical protein n=1 Tax=Streptococcus pluranimalium TaxID=82348 RepID=UPI0039FC795E